MAGGGGGQEEGYTHLFFKFYLFYINSPPIPPYGMIGHHLQFQYVLCPFCHILLGTFQRIWPLNQTIRDGPYEIYVGPGPIFIDQGRNISVRTQKGKGFGMDVALIEKGVMSRDVHVDHYCHQLISFGRHDDLLLFINFHD